MQLHMWPYSSDILAKELTRWQARVVGRPSEASGSMGSGGEALLPDLQNTRVLSLGAGT